MKVVKKKRAYRRKGKKVKKHSQRYKVKKRSIPLSKAKVLTLYHGTSTDNYDKIMSKGLRPGLVVGKQTFPATMRDDKGEHAYLTSKPSYAAFYAQESAKKDKSAPIVLKAKINRDQIVSDLSEDWFSRAGQDEFLVKKINPSQIKGVLARGESKVDNLFHMRKLRDWGKDDINTLSDKEFGKLEGSHKFRETFK